MRSFLFRLLVLTLLVSFLGLPAQAQPAPTPSESRSGQDSRSASAPVLGEIEGAAGEAVYIIAFKDAPLASYMGGTAGLAATSPSVTGQGKLDIHSIESQAYLSYLETLQDTFLASLSKALGRSVDVLFSYRHAYNGLAVILTPEEAQAAAKLEAVAQVYRDRDEELLTDTGPAFIGASSIWGGGLSNRGFTAQLSGTQEVPPTASSATGTAAITYDLTTRTLSWSINHNLPLLTAAHFHNAPAGSNGAVVITLDHTQNPITGSLVLTEQQQGYLVNSRLYINLHTTALPAGEIRGQVLPSGSLGEGVIIGVLDTGINADHPSFAAVGGDGYQHTNPFGEGNYVGYCSANPSFCNSKLIGAWSFVSEAVTPEDSDGHGSHTAATAAGNVLANAQMIAPTASYTFPFVSGVAPHANIIAYDVCVSTCPTSATTAAVNQAVIDGVDVLNYSISGGTNPYTETTIQAFLNANAAGILTAASAGNSGPTVSTVNHQEPWNLTVAASTHDRIIANSLTGLTSSSGPLSNIAGEGPTSAYGPAPLVFAGRAPYNNPLCNPFPNGTFSGQIVVCDRGVIGRVEKGANVLAAGGGGMVLINDLPSAASLSADTHVLPATHISYADGLALKTWLAAGSGHTGSISGGTVSYTSPGDSMASFSSRGPATTMVATIKPDITAPGLNILAAYRTAGSPPPPEYNIISGTSMSSPHVAGAAALLRALHSSWSPAEVKSALMMTGLSAISKEDGSTAADPFDLGSGRVNLPAAAKVGFVLDISTAEYLAANPANSGDPTQLNLPSLANDQCTNACTWTRTIRSVLNVAQEYSASVEAPAGFLGSVSPASFSLAPGASQQITITIQVAGGAPGLWTFASVQIAPVSGEQVSTARIPAAFIPYVTNEGRIEVEPSLISLELPSGDQIYTTTLSIGNAGLGFLTWDLLEVGTLRTRPGLDQDPAPFATAQETFDDFFRLRSKGWVIANKSTPLGTKSWFQGNPSNFTAHSGPSTSYVAANYESTTGANTISSWLLTPDLLFEPGSTFSFWTRTVSGSTWPDRLEVRWSGKGASAYVGDGPSSVGDFDTLLLSINPTLAVGGYPTEWTQFTVDLPEMPWDTRGRIGFRYFVSNGGPAGANSNYIGLDSFQYSPARGRMLYDSGPFVSSFGTGPGGTDSSVLQNLSLGLTTPGFSSSLSEGTRLADQFTVSTATGWFIEEMIFYAYQPGSTTLSTMTGLDLNIWNGPPNQPASELVYSSDGDNSLLSSGWTNAYRTAENDVHTTTRPIMAVHAQVNTFLPHGTYWLDWAFEGSLPGAGPFVPPVTRTGQAETGQALQFSGGEWTPALDAGTSAQQALPFRIYGETDCDYASDIPWLSAAPTSGIIAPGQAEQVEITIQTAGLSSQWPHNSVLCVASSDSSNPQVTVPVEVTILEPEAPTASFSAPESALVGALVDFTNTSQPGALPVSYAWDFGDGAGTSSAQSPQYAYAEPGVFTVTLTAQNSAGESQFSKAILITPLAVETDLSVEVSFSPALVRAGRLTTLTAVVRNAGPGPASGVLLSAVLPESVEFVSSSDCSLSGDLLTCQLGSIGADASKDARFEFRIGSPGSVSLSFTVNGLEPDQDQDNNSGTVLIEVLPAGYDLFVPIVRRQ